MMIYKPHLAFMLPFALLAGRRWLVVFVTGATAALLVGPASPSTAPMPGCNTSTTLPCCVR